MSLPISVVRFSEADRVLECKGCRKKLLVWDAPRSCAIHELPECEWFLGLLERLGELTKPSRVVQLDEDVQFVDD
jgi:hypothetical protein